MKADILIVEDNRDLAENLAELFEDEGATVAVCSTGKDAEALAQGRRFDLIVVDIRLGAESGLDLIPRLRRHNGQSEVVLITGNATLDSAIEAIGRGVFAYVQKPFAPEQILALARRALAQVALRREKHALSVRLEASEALYRDVIETVEACILGLDHRGMVRFANRYSAECAGRSLPDMIGAPFTQLWHDISGISDAQAYLAQVLAGDSLRDVERVMRRPDGSLRSMRWNLARLEPGAHRRDDPEAAVVLAVGLDITERVELERRNAESQALAAMGTLTTGLAHEIRNPLNAAKLQLELLVRRAQRSLETEVASRITQPAETVRAEIERLSELLNEFLQLARPRALALGQVGLTELLEDVVELQLPVAHAAHVELRMQLDRALWVRGDYPRLKQVLLNLVANAIDAMRDRGHGRIELTADPLPDDQVRIRVCDDGPGVAPELLADAFQPFVTNKEAGTGLGLAIVKTLIDRHGGRVELLPGVEGGTVAEIVLRAAGRSLPPPARD